MVSSSITFCPHLWRVIRNLFRLLLAVWYGYGSTSIQCLSKGSCSLHVFGHNLRADFQQHTLVSPLNSGANAAPTSLQALMFPRDGLKLPAIECLALGLSPAHVGLIELPSAIATLGTIPVCGRLGMGVNPLNMPRAHHRASEGKHS